MKDRWLRSVGLWIAVAGGMLSFVSLFARSLRPTVGMATSPVWVFVVLLIVRTILSPYYRRGIDMVNAHMRRDGPWPPRRMKLNDPEWGLFGIRAGDDKLLWVRAILVLGTFPMTLFGSQVGAEPVVLWWASAMLAMVLSLMYGAIAAQDPMDW